MILTYLQGVEIRNWSMGDFKMGLMSQMTSCSEVVPDEGYREVMQRYREELRCMGCFPSAMGW